MRGIGFGGRGSFGGQRWLPCGIRARGKHRTEVTEATEGDWGWWTRELGWTALASVREYAPGESIAQRSRRPQRGLGLVDERAWVDSVGFRAGYAPGESIAQGK
jgi:hypothetical protein